MNPTARSKQWAEKRRYKTAFVERSFRHIKWDCFGFGDLIVMDDQQGAALWQVTTTDNINARIDKIIAIPEAIEWLERGNRIEVHGWAKRGEKGKRKLWTLKRMKMDIFIRPDGGKCLGAVNFPNEE